MWRRVAAAGTVLVLAAVGIGMLATEPDDNDNSDAQTEHEPSQEPFASPTLGPSSSASPPLPLPAGTWVHRSGAEPVSRMRFAGELPVFEQRFVGDGRAVEPTLGIHPDGTLVFAGATIMQDTAPAVRLWWSSDEGRSWRDSSPRIGAVATSPVSLDPFVHTDFVTGRTFNVDLLFACNNLQHTDDHGETWRSTAACQNSPNDHQSITTGPPVGQLLPGYPRNVYLCFTAQLGNYCMVSWDGGSTWQPRRPAYGLLDGQEGGFLPESGCSGTMGHVHASESTGTVFVGRAGSCLDHVEVARSADGGLTWTHAVIDDSMPIDDGRPGYSEHDVELATDAAGNAYAVWVTADHLPWLSVSKDDGVTWGAPMMVAAPGITAAKMPNVVAGAAGRIAISYVATWTPSGMDVHGPGHEGELANATWHGLVAMSLNAAAPDPVFATTHVGAPEDPLARGACLDRCMKDTWDGMYDFLDIDAHPATGQVFATFVDLCTGPCAGAAGTPDDIATSRGAVGVQVAGTMLGAPFPG